MRAVLNIFHIDNLNLGRRILLSIVIVILLSITTTLFLVNTVVEREVLKVIRTELERTQDVFESFDAFQTQEYVIKNRLFSQISFVKALVNTKHPATLSQFAQDSLDKVQSDLFIVTDENGRTLANTDTEESGENLSEVPSIRMALEGRGSQGNGLFQSEGVAYRLFTVAVESGGAVIGTLSMGYIIDDRYAQKITMMTRSQTSLIMNGQVIASVWADQDRAVLADALITMKDRIRTIQDGAKISAPFDMKMGSETFATLLIPILDGEEISDGFYLIQVSRDKSMAVYDNVERLILIIGLLSILFAMLVSLVVARQISNPIAVLVGASNAVTNGNLSIKSFSGPLDGIRRRQDEVGLLAKSFMTMVGKLKKIVLSLRQASIGITGAADALSSSSHQMAANAKAVQEKSRIALSTSEVTNKNVQSVASAAEEMSVTIKEIAGNLQNASQITTKAVEMAESTDATIIKLSTSSAQIKDVIKLITGIAQQTNLLALNATIEAARAGEAGKGFSVVANEVKELAMQTTEATEEIGKTIAMIQTDSDSAVKEIKEIREIINQISGISDSITHTMEEQAKATQDISKNMTVVAKGAHAVALNISSVLESSQNTAQGASEIMGASENLAQLSFDMNEIVEEMGKSENHPSKDDLIEAPAEGRITLDAPDARQALGL